MLFDIQLMKLRDEFENDETMQQLKIQFGDNSKSDEEHFFDDRNEKIVGLAQKQIEIGEAIHKKAKNMT